MFQKQIKKMKLLDFALTKLGIAAFMLFLMGIWPAFRNWILGVSPFYFLAISLVAVAIVELRVWRKK